MSVIDDLVLQATSPHEQGGSSALSTLSLMAQLGALGQQGGGQGAAGAPGGGGIGPPLGHIDGPIDYQHWAENFGQAGVPESLLVPLIRNPNAWPVTDHALWARPDLAAAFRSAARAYHQDTGDWLAQSLVSGWRPFQSSSSKATDMRNSDHWLAGAIDLAANSAADEWMRQHGGTFGFGNQAAGYNWGDPGHFSFTAGGFLGSHSASGSTWGDPTDADRKWIILAEQLFGRR